MLHFQSTPSRSTEFYTVQFLYTINPDAHVPIMLINTHIGKDAKGVEGIMGNEFQRELLELERRGKKSIEIWINTVGGVVTDGWNIYGTLQLTKMHVEGIVIGIAASTGGWIFQGCHKRTMMDNALLMMHNPHGGDSAGQKEFTDSIATMLESKTHKTKEEVLALMNATTFMDAETCEKNGLCDEVKPSKGKLNKIKIPLENRIDENFALETWEEGNKFLNSILPTKNNKMKEVTNYLNLTEDASASTIVAAFSTKVKTEVDKAKNDMTDTYNKEKEELENKHKSEMKDLQDKFDKLCNETAEQKKKMEEEEDKKNETECSNALTIYAKQGRITEAEIPAWKDTVNKIGLPAAKTLIEKLPINIIAPTFNDASAVAAGIKPEEMEVCDVNDWKNKKNEWS